MNMQILQSNDFYRTADLALAAAISIFVPLEAIDKTDYRRAYFVFPYTEELEELVAAFWRKELKVEPQAYFDQLRAIKTRLYAQY